MQRTMKFGRCPAMLVAALAAACLFPACQPESGNLTYPDAGTDDDAGMHVGDADTVPESGSADADSYGEEADVVPDGDVEEGMDPREALALCLADLGAVVYGAYWCGACRYQRLQFAPYHELIDYVDCYFDPDVGILDEPKEECREVELVEEDGTTHGIEAFPTWTFDANPHHDFFVGATDMPTLAELSGCPWLGEPDGKQAP